MLIRFGPPNNFHLPTRSTGADYILSAVYNCFIVLCMIVSYSECIKLLSVPKAGYKISLHVILYFYNFCTSHIHVIVQAKP